MNYKIKSKIWIEGNEEILLGEGRVSLLKGIEETGSLSKAAKAMGMSYKKAWSLIDAVNSRAKEPVCNATIGGKKGGGTEITPYGKSLIKAYETIQENCREFLEIQISQANLK